MKYTVSEPHKATQLLDLPNELLESIAKSFYSLSRHGFNSCLTLAQPHAKTRFNTLDYYEQRVGLSNLSKTSHRLRNICQPVLYEEFVPIRPSQHSIASLPYLNSMRPVILDSRLHLFIMAVIRRPDLAARVRRVHLSADILTDTPEQMGYAAVKFASKICGFDLTEFVNLWDPEYLLKRHDLRYNQRCSQKTGGMLVTVLIGLLPNLYHLSIQSGWMNKRQVPPRAIQMVSGTKSLPLRVLDISNFWCGIVYQHVPEHKWKRITAKEDARFDEQKEDMVRPKSLEDWPGFEPVDLEEGNNLPCRIGV
ncbi:hypothetical protein QBC38DRAFT_482430 [Podospora fimiseda]|uniref:Uncharacterized protein n=1 Tax=Podospora fimiseda TaxID=252190 RepID=A0AAN7BLS9_9PEZI|nr:hypothetical protein QBC38DRAFT_482430 [Podospora fimiseda]